MYSFLHELLKDKTENKIFTLFSGWHFLYILLTICVITAVYIIEKKNQNGIKEKTGYRYEGHASKRNGNPRLCYPDD